MLTLYIANKNYSSWSLRPWVLLKHLQLPFEERLVPFGSNIASGGFLEFSPTGRVPCLIHNDLVVWDSMAIIEYVAELAPNVWPRHPQVRAWARAASAEMHSGFTNIRNTCTMNCGLRIRLSQVAPELTQEWARIDELWQQGLTKFGGPFLAGSHFTAADAFFAPLAFRAQTYSPNLSPAAYLYVDRLLALPAMKEWYEAALQEVWRDEDHETEAQVAGKWLHDLRTTRTNVA